MRKSKNLILILLSILTLTFMVGCKDSSNTKKDDSTKKVELTISAAASLKEAMADIEPLFKNKYSNITLTFNYGSSGSLQEQIEQGAPADLFISAGQKQMTALVDGGFILDGSNKNLVQNSLVLVGPSDTTITSLNEINSDSVTHIAMGEPDSVPAGKYAKEVLTNSNLLTQIESKLVYAKDVKEVLSWATSGNADVGFVYLSDAISSNSAKIIETIDESLHSPITYPVGVIKESKNIDAAKDFENFLFSDEAAKIFEKYGYTMVK